MNTKDVKKEFRISSKTLFLTYPQCGIKLEKALEQLQIKLATYVLADYLLVHKNNNVSVFLKFKKELSVRDKNLLNLKDGPGVFIGTYMGGKNERATIERLLKGVVDFNKILVSKNLKFRINKERFLSLDAALIQLAGVGRIEEAMRLLEDEDPKTYIKNHARYEKSFREMYLKELKEKGFTTKFDFSQFNVPNNFKESITEMFNSPKKSLYVYGPTGTGKSEMILSFLAGKHLQPLLVDNIYSLGEFDEFNHKSIVFDNCNITRMKREELIKLFDSEAECTIKVGSKNIRLPRETPRFFIYNLHLDFILNKKAAMDGGAIKRRIIFLEIKEKLF